MYLYPGVSAPIQAIRQHAMELQPVTPEVAYQQEAFTSLQDSHMLLFRMLLHN